MLLFIETAKFIAAVTEALNNLGKATEDIPSVGYYIHVELREEGTHRKVGAWSDEIAGDCWYFEPKSEDQ